MGGLGYFVGFVLGWVLGIGLLVVPVVLVIREWRRR
jgi:hypothetical protein